MSDLTAPQPGEKVTITGVVLTSHVHAGNAYYGDYAQLRVKIEDGPDGFNYGDVRLVVSSEAGKWFGRRAQAAEAELTPEPSESMSKGELLALADARGVEIPAKATKAQVLGLLVG